jgi:Flp pilus assembly secretin CpaC
MKPQHISRACQTLLLVLESTMITARISRLRPRSREKDIKAARSLATHIRTIAFVASAYAAFGPAVADEHAIRVTMDYARLVRLPEGAQTIVVGNPMVADVSMIKGNQLFAITGKSFGTTNLIVLDRTGQQVGESTITVVPSTDKVLVQRGSHRESLSCNPRCAPAIDLADDLNYAQTVISAAKAHDGAMSAK